MRWREISWSLRMKIWKPKAPSKQGMRALLRAKVQPGLIAQEVGKRQGPRTIRKHQELAVSKAMKELHKRQPTSRSWQIDQPFQQLKTVSSPTTHPSSSTNSSKRNCLKNNLGYKCKLASKMRTICAKKWKRWWWRCIVRLNLARIRFWKKRWIEVILNKGLEN